MKGLAFNELQDGRCLCGICAGSVIMDSSEAAAIYRQVVDYMESALHLTIPAGMRDVPVLAVDLQSLNDHRSEALTAVHGRYSKRYLPHPFANIYPLGSCSSTTPNETSSSACVRGLTITSKQEIRHMTPGTLRFDPLAHRFLTVHAPSVLRVVENRDVSAVLVLYGLPHDLTAAILAHEAMHVFLKLSKFVPFELQPKAEEGICQLISFKYLNALSDSGKSDAKKRGASKTADEEEKFRRFFRYQIENDPSPVYGDGFRASRDCEAKLGLDILIEQLAETKHLPLV